MSSFLGSKKITLEPGDLNLTYSFEISVCSSSSANDGMISYGATCSGITVTAYKTADENGKSLIGGETEVTDLIYSTPAVSNNIISVSLDYPDTNLKGYYKLEFICALDSGGTKELQFNRIRCEDN